MDSYYGIFESYLNLPSSDENPLSVAWLYDTQQGQPELLAKTDEQGNKYHWRDFEGVKLVCYTAESGQEETQWKICLSDEALKPAINWFHQLFNHPGKHRLLQGMERFYHPQLRTYVDRYKCDACQRYKVDGRGAGQLAPRTVRAAP